MENIRGIATKLFNKNEETGNVFAWISYDSPNGPVEAKMRANAPDLQEGDYFIAEGSWKPSTYKDRTEEIFSAKFLRPHLPETRSSALRWFLRILDQARHGVTPQSAKAFVDRLGDSAALICERDPKRLVEISTDPKRFGSMILADWGRRVSGRKAVRLLEDAGVDKTAIDSLIDAFRDSAFDVLSADPYRAARVPKFGFPNADRVGTKMGIDPLDDRRVAAAMLESVNEARRQGDTYLTLNDVAADLKKRFAIDEETVVAFVRAHVDDHGLPFVLDWKDGRVVAMPRDLFEAEGLIAMGIVKQLATGRRNDERRIGSALDKVFASDKFAKFDEIQRSAVAMAIREPISILTGGPGTGKSTVVEAIVAATEAIEGNVILLCAPTGKATKRLEEAAGRAATTTHRLLEAKMDKQNGGSIFGRNAANPLPSRCFVVCDESSMNDVILMRALVEALPPDGRLLLVGDDDQLSSVDAGQVLADLLQTKTDAGVPIVPRTKLVNVYRQSRGSSIAGGAAEIRNGRVPYMTNKFDGSLILYEHTGAEIMERIKHIVSNVLIKQLNQNPTQFAVLVPQAPGSIGTWAINRELSRLLNPYGKTIPGVVRSPADKPDMPIPRVGDRIMLTENDDGADVMNGDVGTIVAAFDKPSGGTTRPHIRIEFDCGKTVEYPSALWRRLSLAYAITVHKSQGSQYTSVIMPVSSEHENMLDRSILYTGWTRAKKALFIVGEREAIQKAVDNVEKSKRRTRLGEYLKARATAEGYRPSRPLVPPPPPAAAPAPRAPAPMTGFGFQPFKPKPAAEPVEAAPGPRP